MWYNLLKDATARIVYLEKIVSLILQVAIVIHKFSILLFTSTLGTENNKVPGKLFI